MSAYLIISFFTSMKLLLVLQKIIDIGGKQVPTGRVNPNPPAYIFTICGLQKGQHERLYRLTSLTRIDLLDLLIYNINFDSLRWRQLHYEILPIQIGIAILDCLIRRLSLLLHFFWQSDSSTNSSLSLSLKLAIAKTVRARWWQKNIWLMIDPINYQCLNLRAEDPKFYS